MVNAIELIRQVCLLVLAVVCAYTDLAKGKLYNAVTLPAMGLGFAFAFALDGATVGWPHLKAALVAAVVGGGALFLIYLAGGLGAGDVKLMTAAGALAASWTFAVLALMYTALVGAAIGIGVLIWQKRLLSGLKDSARAFFTFRRRKQEEGAPATTIPYGVAIGIGILWAWFEQFVL